MALGAYPTGTKVIIFPGVRRLEFEAHRSIHCIEKVSLASTLLGMALGHGGTLPHFISPVLLNVHRKKEQ
jgi:hypothetical protein